MLIPLVVASEGGVCQKLCMSSSWMENQVKQLTNQLESKSPVWGIDNRGLWEVTFQPYR